MAVFVDEPMDAVIVTVLVLVTALVVIVNVCVLFPAAMLTEDGTVATDVSEECSVTVAPPVGAAEDSSTLPVSRLPPVTEGWTKVRLLKVEVEPEAMVRVCAALLPLGLGLTTVMEAVPALVMSEEDTEAVNFVDET